MNNSEDTDKVYRNLSKKYFQKVLKPNIREPEIEQVRPEIVLWIEQQPIKDFYDLIKHVIKNENQWYEDITTYDEYERLVAKLIEINNKRDGNIRELSDINFKGHPNEFEDEHDIDLDSIRIATLLSSYYKLFKVFPDFNPEEAYYTFIYVYENMFEDYLLPYLLRNSKITLEEMKKDLKKRKQ